MVRDVDTTCGVISARLKRRALTHARRAARYAASASEVGGSRGGGGEEEETTRRRPASAPRACAASPARARIRTATRRRRSRRRRRTRRRASPSASASASERRRGAASARARRRRRRRRRRPTRRPLSASTPPQPLEPCCADLGRLVCRTRRETLDAEARTERGRLVVVAVGERDAGGERAAGRHRTRFEAASRSCRGAVESKIELEILACLSRAANGDARPVPTARSSETWQRRHSVSRHRHAHRGGAHRKFAHRRRLQSLGFAKTTANKFGSGPAAPPPRGSTRRARRRRRASPSSR